MFQSTPPRGGRRNCSQLIARSQRFQSTPPREGATQRSCRIDVDLRSFNPRPRAGGDAAHRLHRRVCRLFQSTPPRGGRLDVRCDMTAGYSSFNPRPRAGGDAIAGLQTICVDDVSIHAPARGATYARRAARLHRLRFQSTPPRGGRHADAVSIARQATGFNPRPRAGGDVGMPSVHASLMYVSIHAPARGATSDRTVERQLTMMFQSTPPRGGRLSDTCQFAVSDQCFNPRPRAGGDADARDGITP